MAASGTRGSAVWTRTRCRPGLHRQGPPMRLAPEGPRETQRTMPLHLIQWEKRGDIGQEFWEELLFCPKRRSAVELWPRRMSPDCPEGRAMGEGGAAARNRSGTLGELTAETYGILWRYGRAHLPRRHRLLEESADVLHDALLEAAERSSSFRGEGERGLCGWLLRILKRSISKTRLKAEGHEPPRSLTEEELAMIAASDTQAERLLEIAESAERLMAALVRRCSEEDRALVRLLFYEEAPIREIARRKGLSAWAIYKTRSRLLARLRHVLSEVRAVAGRGANSSTGS